MKFQFCSDGDCPLWVLAGLHAASTLPAAMFRGIVDCVVEGQNDDDIMEILKETSLSSREESARAAATIRWVVKQAHSSSTSGQQLQRDLLLLAVPRTHAMAISEAVDRSRETYEETARNSGVIINRVTDASISPGPEGSIDAVKLTFKIDDVITGDRKSSDVILDRDQAKLLLGELKKAYKKMEDLDDKLV